MAIYKGREVTVEPLSKTSYEPPENVKITDRGGQSYMVKLSEVEFTEAEAKEFKNANARHYDDVLKIIPKEDKK